MMYGEKANFCVISVVYNGDEPEFCLGTMARGIKRYDSLQQAEHIIYNHYISQHHNTRERHGLPGVSILPAKHITREYLLDTKPAQVRHNAMN